MSTSSTKLPQPDGSDNKENDIAKSLTMPVDSFYSRMSDGRCYPIFRTKNKSSTECRERFGSLLKKPLGKSKITTSCLDKKKRSDRKKKLEQMILDVGQKNFGPKTCEICGMFYSPHNADDTEQHDVFHKRFMEGIRFSGWHNERVLNEYDDGRVIMILPSDPKSHQKKVKEFCSLIDFELGHPTTEYNHPTMKVFLFISKKKVCGGLIAETIKEAYPLITATDSDTDHTWFIQRSCPQPAACGVSRLWVSKEYRLCSIATRMMNCLRKNFICGMVLPKDKIAFSDPTVDGRAFATKYFSNPSFLVYSQRHHTDRH